VTGRPRLSIVIPVYNRPKEVTRALESCLSQTYDSFEVIVVDDESTDETLDVLIQHATGRVKVVRHESNRGVCAARNSGVDAARGDWILFLDSDDALLPGALQVIATTLDDLPQGIQRVAFAYLCPDGRLSPVPMDDGTILDYQGYLRWAETARPSDFCNCIMRSTFEKVKLPESRVYERIYHLDFALHFKTLMVATPVARVYDDAPNRLTNLTLRAFTMRKVREAAEIAAGIETILRRHGAALSTVAPGTFRSLLRQRIEMLLFARERRIALGWAVKLLASHPLYITGWCTVVAGVLGPAALGVLMYFGIRARS
jgi:glycosyltransferase involved in cell wall biosynthesis